MKKLLLLSISILSLSVTAQVCFSPAINYTVGTNPISVTSGDFNGDGKLDLAAANNNSNNVSIRLGTGTGSFGTATNFATGSNPSSITSADFNGDTKLDLAVANSNSANVSILLGTGTGSFGAATNIALPTFSVPNSIISADFNGDGKKDLAVAYSPFSGTRQVAILLGTGTGSFGAATSFPTTSTGAPYSVISADFNGDTKLDLATANYGANNISVLLGTGTGSFGTPTNFVAGTQPVSITTADFNGDGKADLATANYDISNTVSVFLGTGTGSFGAATNLSVGNSPSSITSADFDGDGKKDLAVANGNLYILLGTGTGSFGTATTFTTGNGNYLSSNAADYNGDARPDLAAANQTSSDVSVFLNCTGVGIANFSNEQEISLYPNPNNGNFIIETTSTEKQTVQLIDVTGNLVLSQSINGKTAIDTNSLQNGIYFVSVKTMDGLITKKIIVQH